KRLDRCEHMLERYRATSADPQLAETGISQGVRERPTTLIQDLLAVGDEQQPGTRQTRAKSLIVDRGHHGLARAGRCGEQVAVVSLLAREFDLFEHSLLERLQPDLRRTEQQFSFGRARHALSESRPVVRLEIRLCPVALEN